MLEAKLAFFDRPTETIGCPIATTTLTASGCVLFSCSVALLDDAMFLVVVCAGSTVAFVAYGITRLLSAAGPSRR